MTAQTFSAPGEQSRSSMVFKPAPDRSRWEGLAVASWVVIIDLALVFWLLQKPADGVSFLLFALVLFSLPLLFHLLYRTWGAFSLEYWIDRNALRVRWAATSVVIPLDAIEQIVAESDMTVGRTWRHWPSPFVRSIPWQAGSTAEMLATRPPAQGLWLQTTKALFLISPAEPDAFVGALQELHRLGPSHPLSLDQERLGLPALPLREDRLSRRLLLAGAAGVLILFAVLFFAYPTLPERLIFHYDAAGLPNSIRPKNALFLLPAIGLAAFLVNSLVGLWMTYRNQATGAYLLWGSTLAVQLFSLLALFSLIR